MMYDPIKTVETDKLIIEIYPDDMADNPRTEWDNLGHMACFHGRYDLGDKHIFCNEVNPFATEDDSTIYYEDDPQGLLDFIARKDVISLPLYLYDHSMLALSTRSWIGRAQHAEWDSGLIGFIYVTKEDLLKEYGWKRLTPGRVDKIKRYLEGEVKSYGYYLSGYVFGYKAICKQCEAEIDSCWGFFGEDFTDLLEQANYAECEACKETAERLNSLQLQFAI